MSLSWLWCTCTDSGRTPDRVARALHALHIRVKHETIQSNRIKQSLKNTHTLFFTKNSYCNSYTAYRAMENVNNRYT